jgi:5-methylcytosine-specific restriction endonuclease McrA
MVRVQRKPSVRVGINPYTDKEYFESKYKNLEVEKFRKSIYAKHKYKCAACGEILDNSEAIELHRIIPGKDGGKYTYENTVPLHRTCHLGVTHTRKKWANYLKLTK